MKSLQDLYDEVMGSEELKEAFVQAAKTDTYADFLAAHDCDATLDELQEFLNAKAAEDDPIELSMDELKEAVGGAGNTLSTLTLTTKCPNSNECSHTCIRDCC